MCDIRVPPINSFGKSGWHMQAADNVPDNFTFVWYMHVTGVEMLDADAPVVVQGRISDPE